MEFEEPLLDLIKHQRSWHNKQKQLNCSIYDNVVAFDDQIFIFQYSFAGPPVTVLVIELKVLEQNKLFRFSERAKIYPMPSDGTGFSFSDNSSILLVNCEGFIVRGTPLFHFSLSLMFQVGF